MDYVKVLGNGDIQLSSGNRQREDGLPDTSIVFSRTVSAITWLIQFLSGNESDTVTLSEYGKTYHARRDTTGVVFIEQERGDENLDNICIRYTPLEIPEVLASLRNIQNAPTICPQCGKEVFNNLPVCGNCGAAVHGTVPVIVEAIKKAGAHTDTEWLKNEKQALDEASTGSNEIVESIIQANYAQLEKKIHNMS